MERMLRVQAVKVAGPGFNSMSPERRKKSKNRGTAETEGALGSEKYEGDSWGVCKLGVLLAGSVV